MKKYLRLSCTVCKRTTDKLVDDTHFSPDKCTITFKCEGRLFPVEYRSNANIISAPVTDVTDWRPRGTSLASEVNDATPSFINTATGTTSQIVLAVRMAVDPGIGSTLTLTLNERASAPKNYRQYIYRSEVSFSSVSGVEAGLEKKTLRYTTTDNVEVYLNGVKLEQGLLPENYQLYDGTLTSSVPPNTVNFNQQIALPGITQVDVIVSPAVVTTQVLLTFNRNQSDESRLNTGSWENVDRVEQLNASTWRPYYLFTLDLADATQLNLNTILTAASNAVVNGFINIPAADIEILLAREPYSILDRYTNLVVPLTTLGFERDYLKYYVVNGVSVLYVTETAVAPVFPLLRVQKFSTEKTIQTALAGVTDQIVVDGSVIVGPDA